jgi:REP element-mobilizing transposase RayT
MDTLTGPLAYFITFHTFGTWLPGDERGSVDVDHKTPGAPYAESSPPRVDSIRRSLKQAPAVLQDEERTVILRTIQEVCRHRAWILRAAHVRTNHVHVVVVASLPPERVMNDLKVWATRRVVEAGLRPRGTHLWVRHGSTRYLWDQEAVDATCAYVIEGQGRGREWAHWGESAC